MKSMRSQVAGLAIGTCLLGGAGCAVTATVPVGSAELYYGEPYTTGYPYTVYDGRTVYWYGNRWLYHDGGRWYAYREEPPDLYRYRTTVQQAPPAPRYPGAYPAPGYRPPPPSYYPPNQPHPVPYSAPPAPPGQRVR
jgi:hypothetical protein